MRGGEPEVSGQSHVLAHKHCSLHRSELEKSELCGCFYCLAIFAPSEIVEWIDDGQTAICPKCPVDAVVGSASGFPITRELLQRMHNRWFWIERRPVLLSALKRTCAARLQSKMGLRPKFCVT
jgi:hypothetical protein